MMKKNVSKKKEPVLEEPQTELAPSMAEETPVVVAEPVGKTSVVISEVTDNLSEYDHKMIDKDIKFKGPFSYRHFRMFGWVALSIGMISSVISVVIMLALMIDKITPETAQRMSTVADALSMFSALPLPLFLIANFAVILQKKNQYKKLIITYGGILLAIYVGVIVVYYHYVISLIAKFSEIGFWDARQKVQGMIAGSERELIVNVFVDLFNCVLIMFFIDYTPKKYFQGKKIILFRLLVILPILYEIMSAVFSGLLEISSNIEGFEFTLPLELLPLIGKKPIGMIVGFVLICIYLKLRYKRYLKKGGTPEGYALFEETNRNSFKVSRNMSLIFLVVAIVDLILFGIIAIISYSLAEDVPEVANSYIEMFSAFTIGKSVCLLLVIPLLLLFSYKKVHAKPELDKLVPIGGIILLVFAAFETAFIGLLWL